MNLRKLFLKLPKYGLVVEYGLDGKILKSWHDPNGQVVAAATCATLHNNKLYIGSFYSDFIAVVNQD